MVTKRFEIFQVKFVFFLKADAYCETMSQQQYCGVNLLQLCQPVCLTWCCQIQLLRVIIFFFFFPSCIFLRANRKSIQCKRYFKQTVAEVPSQTHPVINRDGSFTQRILLIAVTAIKGGLLTQEQNSEHQPYSQPFANPSATVCLKC